MDLLARIHSPTHTLTATRTRAELLNRPQETQMDDAILIHLDRDGGHWTALAHPADAATTGILAGDRIAAREGGPAAALEALGLELDRREALRLTALARGDEAPVLSVQQAADLELRNDVGLVVSVLEDAQARAIGDQPVAMTSLRIAGPAGFIPGKADQPLERHVDDPRLEAGAARARRALDQAAREGTVVRLEAGSLELWRIATDDEVERAAAQDDPRGEADR